MKQASREVKIIVKDAQTRENEHGRVMGKEPLWELLVCATMQMPRSCEVFVPEGLQVLCSWCEVLVISELRVFVCVQTTLASRGAPRLDHTDREASSMRRMLGGNR